MLWTLHLDALGFQVSYIVLDLVYESVDVLHFAGTKRALTHIALGHPLIDREAREQIEWATGGDIRSEWPRSIKINCKRPKALLECTFGREILKVEAMWSENIEHSKLDC